MESPRLSDPGAGGARACTLTKSVRRVRHFAAMSSRLGRLALLVAALLSGASARAAAADEAALPPIDAATSLLVVAPHPDDETLCCAGVIQRVLRAGGHA